MSNEQYPLWTFDEHTVEDLKEVVELSNRLDELGFPALSETKISTIENEIRVRGN